MFRLEPRIRTLLCGILLVAALFTAEQYFAPRDPVLGEWVYANFALRFAPDGTVEMRINGKVNRTGAWSYQPGWIRHPLSPPMSRIRQWETCTPAEVEKEPELRRLMAAGEFESCRLYDVVLPDYSTRLGLRPDGMLTDNRLFFLERPKPD